YAQCLNFDTTVITQVNTKYASSFTGTYDSYAVASIPATNSYRFISVTASAADTKNFGLIPNTEYTLKWGNGNSTSCAGDAGFNPGNVPSEHGKPGRRSRDFH